MSHHAAQSTQPQRPISVSGNILTDNLETKCDQFSQCSLNIVKLTPDFNCHRLCDSLEREIGFFLPLVSTPIGEHRYFKPYTSEERLSQSLQPAQGVRAIRTEAKLKSGYSSLYKEGAP